MISYDEALATVLAQAEPLGTERVPLEALAGRFLAEPVAAAFDFPIFDNSAMDGFGVRVADVRDATPEAPARLRLLGEVRAGDAGEGDLAPGTATRILTGAPVPPGVEAVVMRERCEERGGEVLVAQAARPGENIRRRGEEFRAGDAALPAGARATPPVVGLLATFGCASAVVCRRPRVAVLVTGSELTTPGEPLRPGHIYDSNSPMLSAALAGLGIEEARVQRVPDDLASTTRHMAQALEWADLLLTVGGVSVGDYDFVKDACGALGIETLYWQVAIKPGKPNYFGVHPSGRGRQMVFGLPGNPVAAALSFTQLVRPALLKMMGAREVLAPRAPAVLTADLRKKPGRLEFVRGVAREEGGRLVVTPTAGQESHMLGGIAPANCLLPFAADQAFLAAGTPVVIEWVQW